MITHDKVQSKAILFYLIIVEQRELIKQLNKRVNYHTFTHLLASPPQLAPLSSPSQIGQSKPYPCC